MHDVHELMKCVQTGEGLKAFGPPPSTKQWLLMYRQQRKTVEFIADSLFPAPPNEPRVSEILRGILRTIWELGKLSKDELRELIAGIEEEQLREAIEENRMFCLDVAQSQTDLDAWPIPSRKPSIAAQNRLFRSPQIQFILRVWFPCQMLYGISATVLY